LTGGVSVVPGTSRIVRSLEEPTFEVQVRLAERLEAGTSSGGPGAPRGAYPPATAAPGDVVCGAGVAVAPRVGPGVEVDAALGVAAGAVGVPVVLELPGAAAPGPGTWTVGPTVVPAPPHAAAESVVSSAIER
jgi:hypothetical protein